MLIDSYSPFGTLANFWSLLWLDKTLFMETLLPFVLVFDQSLVVCSLVKNCKGFSIPLMCLSSYLITPAHVSYVFIYSNACFYKHIYTTREDSCAPHTTCSHNNSFHQWEDSYTKILLQLTLAHLTVTGPCRWITWPYNRLVIIDVSASMMLPVVEIPTRNSTFSFFTQKLVIVPTYEHGVH